MIIQYIFFVKALPKHFSIKYLSKQVKTKSKENKKSLSLVIDCFSSNQFEEKTAVRALPAIYGTRYFSAHAAQFKNQRIPQTRLDRSVF